jgi:hypothetical protein
MLRLPFRHLLLAAAGAVFCVATSAQAASDIGRPAAVVPLQSEEPPSKLIVYPALAAPLARGVVIVQYRTENARIMPVFGQAAVEVSPRVGHLHVTVDERPGTWAHTSGDPIIVMGLPPGPHTMRIELADPNHKILASETIAVTVPAQSTSSAHAH